VVGYTAADIDTWASLMARSIRAARVTVVVEVLEPGLVERSSGNAKRFFDLRATG